MFPGSTSRDLYGREQEEQKPSTSAKTEPNKAEKNGDGKGEKKKEKKSGEGPCGLPTKCNIL